MFWVLVWCCFVVTWLSVFVMCCFCGFGGIVGAVDEFGCLDFGCC